MQEWQDPFSVRLDRKELEAEQSRKDKKAYRKEGRRLRRISLGIAIITVLIVAGFGVSVFYPDDGGRIFSGMFDFGAQTESGDVSVISADVSDENSAEETNTDETPASEASPAEEETDSGENTQIAETAPENTQNKESNTANEQLTTEPAVETESIYYDASGEILAYELDGKKCGLAPSTVSEIVTTMNSLRLYALKRDFTVLFSTECVSVKQSKQDIRVFSVSEERILITYLRENMNLTALGILICLYTGIRVGELCALKWDEINLEEKTMRIGRTMQRLRVEGKEHKTEVKILEPKSKHSIRTIPLPDVLVGMLSGKSHKGAFVLTGSDTRFVEPRVMQNRFKRILKKCGIEDANFHATRHTFATRCVDLGHASVSITMNKYVHPTMELKAENMNKFTGLFGD